MTSTRRQQYARRAAQLGMTLAEFVSFLAAEQRKVDELNALTRDRDTQYDVIRRYATARGRSWSVHR